MYGIAEFLWGAVLGERSAAWLFQASDEQRRNGPQRNSAANNIKFNGVAPKCGPRVVALLAKGVTISRVATPSGIRIWGQRYRTLSRIRSRTKMKEHLEPQVSAPSHRWFFAALAAGLCRLKEGRQWK